MDLQAFKSSLSETTAPNSLGPALRALWEAKKGNWDRSHKLVQDEAGKDCAWVHAFLHRQEGDYSNACYWYARARKNVPPENADLEEEWELLADTLLAEI